MGACIMTKAIGLPFASDFALVYAPWRYGRLVSRSAGLGILLALVIEPTSSYLSRIFIAVLAWAAPSSDIQ